MWCSLVISSWRRLSSRLPHTSPWRAPRHPVHGAPTTCTCIVPWFQLTGNSQLRSSGLSLNLDSNTNSTTEETWAAGHLADPLSSSVSPPRVRAIRLWLSRHLAAPQQAVTITMELLVCSFKHLFLPLCISIIPPHTHHCLLYVFLPFQLTFLFTPEVHMDKMQLMAWVGVRDWLWLAGWKACTKVIPSWEVNG